MTTPTRLELAAGVGTTAMALGAFGGHLVAPDRMADHFGWPRDRWYQREIGAFNAGLGAGVAATAVGRDDDAFLYMGAVSALLLAATRAAALAAGDRRGRRNLQTVVGDAVLGGLAVMALRQRRATRSRGPR